MAMMRLGGAGVRIGLGSTIFTIGCFGNSGGLIWGTVIFGVSIFTISGSFGLGGRTLGLTGSGFFCTTGTTNSVSMWLFWIACLAAAALRTMMTNPAIELMNSDTNSEPLLWAPASRTPKWANCMLFCGPEFALRRGAAMIGIFPCVGCSATERRYAKNDAI